MMIEKRIAVAADGGRQVVSWDIDPAAVEKNYFLCPV